MSAYPNPDTYPLGSAPIEIDPYAVEANLPPAVRRAVRLARIEAYEGTRWAEYIPGERICLEFGA
jgi:hypothetical protein